MTDADPAPANDAPLTWERANLHPDRAAALLALGDGLASIGRLRTGRRSGQLSIFNFRLRAAGEASEDASENDPQGPLILLMGAGVIRRHTFFCRYTPLAATPDRAGDGGAPATLALPGAIDRDWDWWPPFEEVRDRIIGQPVWMEAVGVPYADHLSAFTTVLQDARLITMGSAVPTD